MKFKDIFFSGITFWVSFLTIYYTLERLQLVPYITIYDVNWIETFDWYHPAATPNYAESFIIAIIVIQTIWLGSQIVYWRFFKKEKVE